MIIGNGDIASAINDSRDKIFFASGVSYSKETRESEYTREIDLLLLQDKSSHIVYFSSLSVFYSDTRYTKHKLYMEKLVKGFNTWTIIRLGNITWGTNPHTIINHFKEQRRRGEKLVVHNTERYICELDEFKHWIELIPNWSCEMNIPGKRMKIKDIIKKYA